MGRYRNRYARRSFVDYDSTSRWDICKSPHDLYLEGVRMARFFDSSPEIVLDYIEHDKEYTPWGKSEKIQANYIIRKNDKFSLKAAEAALTWCGFKHHRVRITCVDGSRQDAIIVDY